MNFWGALGIEPTTDKMAIRHAYAEKTRICHPEEDPEGFDRLHTAFTAAMQYARRNADKQTVMEKQPVELKESTVSDVKADLLYAAPSANEKAKTVNTRRSAKERYARGKASRESRQKIEQRVLEEYFLQARRCSQQQIELGRGSQEEGQKFDFDAVEQVSCAPIQQDEKTFVEQPRSEKLTHEEIAWINTPGLQQAVPSEPIAEPNKSIPQKTRKQEKPKQRIRKKVNGQELLPIWAIWLLPVAAMLLGQYIVAVILAVLAAWYDMHTTDFKHMRKQVCSRITAMWCVGIVLIPIVALWIIAIAGGIRGGQDDLDVMAVAVLMSVFIAPAGLIGIYTSKKAKTKKKTAKAKAKKTKTQK